MCADLYDLIEQVQEMMVFNTSSSIRGLCASIFIQFLLDYPLENDRIESHLNFILKNLACKRLEGRLQLLDILKTLIERLPKDVVELYCELLFFTLLLRAVNEPSVNGPATAENRGWLPCVNSKVRTGDGYPASPGPAERC